MKIIFDIYELKMKYIVRDCLKNYSDSAAQSFLNTNKCLLHAFYKITYIFLVIIYDNNTIFLESVMQLCLDSGWLRLGGEVVSHRH